MLSSCKPVATVPLSPAACTLYWCRVGNVKVCMSSLLSSLVCLTRFLFFDGRFHVCRGSVLMRTSLPMPSAEAASHVLKLLAGFWQLRRVSAFIAFHVCE